MAASGGPARFLILGVIGGVDSAEDHFRELDFKGGVLGLVGWWHGYLAGWGRFIYIDIFMGICICLIDFVERGKRGG